MKSSAMFQSVVSELVSERKRRGLSQEDVAKWVGVTRQQISHWEGGKGLPDMLQVAAWAEGYGWEVSVQLHHDAPQAASLDDFAGVVGRLAPLWSHLPGPAQRAIGEVIRAFELMADDPRK